MSSAPQNSHLSPEQFDLANQKLGTVPFEQWPSEYLYWKVLTLVRLQSMENAEREALGR